MTDEPDLLDKSAYETTDEGFLTYAGILDAVSDNPAFSRHPFVMDSARYLYRDNDSRWKFWNLFDEFTGGDEPDVPEVRDWKRTIVSEHEINWDDYGVDGDGHESGPSFEPPTVQKPEETVTWSEVEEAILEYFDQATLEACEVLATVPIQLMFDDFTDCPMVILVGNASSGKTTALELFKGWDRIYTTHEVTPAAFVSHNVDQSEENLGEMDLLPKIVDQVLWVPEMGTWFSGNNIQEYMRTLSGVADGSGYMKSTGAQGSHGYDGDPGDYQFGLMGATTPPDPSAWSEMGNAGARVLMHGMPNTQDDDKVRDQIFGNSNVPYPKKKKLVKEKIKDWLRTLWHNHDGSIEMKPEDPDGVVAHTLVHLADIIARGRGVSYGRNDEVGEEGGQAQIEDRKRVVQMLRFTARARAAMDGRKEVTTDDLQPCARIAFATMPEQRRKMVRLLCNPQNGKTFTTSDVKTALDLGSKHTAKSRMQTVARLGLAEYETEGKKTQGGVADVVRVADEKLMWLFSKNTEDENAGPLSWPFGD